MRKFDHISGKYITIDQSQIYYETIGDEKNPVIVLLHGALGNIEDFNTIISHLPNKYRIIGIDSRGHGKSTLGSKALTYELLQNDIEIILKELKIKEPIIIGFSNGGTVAYRLAALTNVKINKIITIGAPWHTKHLEHLMQAYATLTGDIWKKHSPTHYESYKRLNPKPEFNSFFRQCVKMAIDKTSSGRPNEAVKNISCPLLILRGENDPIVTNSDIMELSNYVKNALIINIPSAGHEVFRQHSRIFIEHVNKFLDLP
ncbi:MAG: alpha/beta hydrolase [Candidatus Protochlamydia sp.]|nr:alpha/beta hydrolase [Candidatus Protochlamydia sp.]